MKKKIYSQVDLIKIIACALVIVNHTCSYISPKDLFYSLEFVLCRIAVPLFIMCTGYLTFEKETNLKYTLKKIGRIAVPLVLFSLLIFILQEKTFKFSFFISLIQNPIIEQYWYLYMMIGLYIIQPYLNKMLRQLSNVEYVILIAISLILPALNLKLSPYFFLANFTYVVGYYAVGAFLKKKIEIKKMKYVYLIIFLLSYFTGIYLLNTENMETFHINSILVVMMSISFMAFMIQCPLKIPNKTRFNFISESTFGIYLLHPILQNKIYDLKIMKDIISLNRIFGILVFQLSVFLICLILVYIFKSLKKMIIKKFDYNVAY